jgi:hypothetical protein
MQETILITNHHPDGFAFALNEAGEQIFIPPYAIDGTELQRGKRYQAVLIENHKEHQRERTPWMAVSVLGDTPAPVAEPDPIEVTASEPVASIEQRDAAVYKAICDSQYMTSPEIAAQTGTDTSTAINSANRLFAKGMVAKADVYSRAGQTRASFSLWAQNANSFTE